MNDIIWILLGEGILGYQLKYTLEVDMFEENLVNRSLLPSSVYYLSF